MGKPKHSITKLKKKSKPKNKSKRRPSAKGTQILDLELFTPPVSMIEPPDGFRALGNAQATMEYGSPMLNLIPKGNNDIMIPLMQIIMYCWNCGITSHVSKLTLPSPKDHQAIIVRTSKLLKIDKPEAEKLIQMMIDRKEYLVPQDIQPKIPLITFVRKEKLYTIKKFDLGPLNLSREKYPPEEEDEKQVTDLQELDRLIAEADYDSWEDHYFAVSDACLQRMGHWLDHKGMEHQTIGNLLFCNKIFLNFVYMYGQSDECNLRTVKEIHLIEFFSDYVLRKATMDPPNYAQFPPAMRLLYRFLQDIGYLKSSLKIIRLIDSAEPVFIRLLKERYE